MAYQEVGRKPKYYKYKECKPGQVLAEGYYRGTIQGKFGDQYKIEDEEGQPYVLGKAGQLSYKLDNIDVGDWIKVVYLGMERIETANYGSVDSHQFQVFRDPDHKDGSAPEYDEAEDVDPDDMEGLM